jgi:hypothetical protein
MDLTEKEAFRLGFLTRCAEEGLTGEDLRGRVKQASVNPADWLLPIGAGGLGLYLASRSPVVGPLVGLVPAAGLAAGSALGYGAAKVTEPNISADDIKAQELADTYRIYAQRARANRQAKKYRQARGSL